MTKLAKRIESSDIVAADNDERFDHLLITGIHSRIYLPSMKNSIVV